MRRSDPDEKQILFRQQASPVRASVRFAKNTYIRAMCDIGMVFQAAIVSRKKEAAAEQMEQLQAELSQVLSELEDKRQKSAAYADTHAVLRGEEFKQYVTKLR